MKRPISIILIVSLFALELSGCTALKKKFTRKKKEKPKIIRYRPVTKYEKRPNAELYQKHFVYWKTWQSDLIRRLGESRKRDTRCIDEIITNLEDMKKFLVDEKAKELQPHIDKLLTVREGILSRNLSKYNKDFIGRTLKREMMAINRGFAYGKVKDFLKKDSDEKEDGG